MTLAALFPGQGAHVPGMASAWDGHPAAVTFDEVGRACGIADLRRLADDAEACRSTAVAQPAVFAAGIAAWRALDVAPVVVAGHSLGECTAAVAAGVLSVADGAALVGERGRAFAEACSREPGTMVAVLAIEREVVRAICADVPGAVLANDNAPGQVVVAGPPDAVDEAATACRDAGARIRPLEVEGAFHTPAMAPAMVRVAAFLRRLDLSDPAVPVVSGVDGQPAVSAAQVARVLVEGILAPVRWRAVQERLAADGVTEIVECGPGRVLAGLAKRTVPDLVPA